MILLTLYVAGAITTAAYALYAGVAHQPHERLLTAADQLVLVVVSLLVGAFWPLFVPGLLVQGLHHVAVHRKRGGASRPWGWSSARAAQARP